MTVPTSDSAALEESLRHAAMFGDTETVERLLDSGVNIDAAGNRGWTALLRATSQRHFSITRLLIERGADVNQVDKRGRSPLLWVAQCGDVETARLLLEKGAKGHSTDGNGKTPIKQAISAGRLDIVELLLQYNIWEKRFKSGCLDEALFCATEEFHTQMMVKLLEAGANPNRAWPWISWKTNWKTTFHTPLMLAAVYDNQYLARPLLDHGADPNYKTSDRRSAMTEALKERLASQYTESSSGWLKKLLLKRGAIFGLEEAVIGGDLVLAKTLLEQGGADVEMPDANGQTLLMWAVTHGNHATVHLLIEYGANINRADHHHETPLMKAAKRGDLATVKYLFARGANPRFIVRSSGWIAFDFAAAHGHLEVAAWLLENDNLGFGPYRGGSTLAAAAGKGHLSTVRLLLDNGVNPNTATNLLYGRTALMWAGCRRRADIARLLIEQGADTNQRDGRGNTALDFAAGSGSKTVIRLLLDHGADKQSIEKAIAGAVYAKRESVAELLREALNRSA